MKNHIMPPAEFIAPPNFRTFQVRDGDVHNFHHAPYLPTMRCVRVLITICGQKGYGN